MKQKVIREIKIGSPLYDTVIRKVEEQKPIKFMNGLDIGALGLFNIIGAKMGKPGFMNVELERADDFGEVV